jgi:hypothetical protein
MPNRYCPPAFEMAEKGGFYGLRISTNNDIICVGYQRIVFGK